MLFAACAAMLASCSNDEDFAPQNDLKGTPITISSANVAELTTSRSISENKLTGDRATLGLYVINSNRHGCYTFNASSKEWYNDDPQMLCNGSNFKWIAYSPGHISRNYFFVPTNGDYGGDSGTYQNPTSVSGSRYDLLWGTGSSNSAELTPTLNHVLTMLTVNITLGNEIDGAPTVEAVTIGNTCTDCGLYIYAPASSYVVLPKDNKPADITAMKLATANNIPESDKKYNASFEALIIPQTAELKLTVELSNGRTFTKTLTSKEFLSGKHYIITLQIGKNKVEIADGGITVASWGAAINGGELATE